MKSADVTLLGKLSEPLKELLEYEVHKETAPCSVCGPEGDAERNLTTLQVMLHPFFHYLGECVLSLMVVGLAKSGVLLTKTRTGIVAF